MKYKDLIESTKSVREIELSIFEDYEKLVRKIGKINIEGKTIRYLFDNEEYDQNSLYIL